MKQFNATTIGFLFGMLAGIVIRDDMYKASDSEPLKLPVTVTAGCDINDKIKIYRLERRLLELSQNTEKST